MRVRPLEGGIDAWRAAGYPVEAPAAPPPVAADAGAVSDGPGSDGAATGGRSAAILSVLVLSLFVAGAAAPSATSKSTSDKLLRYLQFTPDEQAAIRRGTITSHVVKEFSDKELALTMAVLAPAPLDKLLDAIRSDRLLEADRQILAHGPLSFGSDGSLDPEALAQVGFTASEGSELRELFEAGPGSKLNLSASETRTFAEVRRASSATACDKEPACAQSVVSALRTLLHDRAVAYRARGLGGIEPYARAGGPPSDPAADLRQANEAARFLGDEYPAIYEAWRDYPKGDPAVLESRFLWLKQMVQDRPAFILSHRVWCQREGIAFAAERQFYVTRSYNALQIFVGLIPEGDKTLLVYFNRTSSDQVAGFPSVTRHSVGRRILEKAVRTQLEEMLAQP
ncbi:MAG TPA: hypothetical protein VFQ07_05800 [Candidatus Polarisedimenticolia bacterium]|nr:hypothetical protein [Candidatus Polarisedimenticolia bacterium]